MAALRAKQAAVKEVMQMQQMAVQQRLLAQRLLLLAGILLAVVAGVAATHHVAVGGRPVGDCMQAVVAGPRCSWLLMMLPVA